MMNWENNLVNYRKIRSFSHFVHIRICLIALCLSILYLSSVHMSTPIAWGNKKDYAHAETIGNIAEQGSISANYDEQNKKITVQGSGTLDRTKWRDFLLKTTQAHKNTDIGISFEGAISFPENSTELFSHVTGLIHLPDSIDTSHVKKMTDLFAGATNANPNISTWNTSNVEDMSGMFRGARKANPDISGWDVRKVTNMASMFEGAENANPDISSWVFHPNVDKTDFLKGSIADPNPQTRSTMSAQPTSAAQPTSTESSTAESMETGTETRMEIHSGTHSGKSAIHVESRIENNSQEQQSPAGFTLSSPWGIGVFLLAIGTILGAIAVSMGILAV